MQAGFSTAREVTTLAGRGVGMDVVKNETASLGGRIEIDSVTELWQVITGATPGRTSPAQVTLFDSVGFAIEDFSALRYIRSKLAETGLYTDLDMIADPDDPRDLFGMILRAG